MNGVLLSVAEPNGFPALSIELIGGKVSVQKLLMTNLYNVHEFSLLLFLQFAIYNCEQ